MADETAPEQPLAHLAEVEQNLSLPEPAPEPVSGAERLRAFEDANFGKKAVRIQGRVERGSGSPYQAMTPAKRRHYQALEKLVEADDKLAAAHSALIAADVEHEAALAAVALAEKQADEEANA